MRQGGLLASRRRLEFQKVCVVVTIKTDPTVRRIAIRSGNRGLFSYLRRPRPYTPWKLDLFNGKSFFRMISNTLTSLPVIYLIEFNQALGQPGRALKSFFKLFKRPTIS